MIHDSYSDNYSEEPQRGAQKKQDEGRKKSPEHAERGSQSSASEPPKRLENVVAELDRENPASERPKRCGARTAAGDSCRAPATLPDGRCFSHSEHVSAEQRTRARARGGANTGRIVKLARFIETEAPELGELSDEIAAAVVAVLRGSLPPARGQAAASLARAYASLRLVGELEQRVAMLEARGLAA